MIYFDELFFSKALLDASVSYARSWFQKQYYIY